VAQTREAIAHARELESVAREDAADRVEVALGNADRGAFQHEVRDRLDRNRAARSSAKVTAERASATHPDQGAPSNRQESVDWADARRDYLAEHRDQLADEAQVRADEREALANEREEMLSDLAEVLGSEIGASSSDRRRRKSEAEIRAHAAAARDVAATERMVKRVEQRSIAPNLLAAEFVSIGQCIMSASTIDEALRVVLEHIVNILDGCEAATLTRLQVGRFSTVASTAGVAVDVDMLQYTYDEGPCVEAVRSQGPVRTGDLRADDRWPSLRRSATGNPMRSVLSCGLSQQAPDGDLLESINTYGTRLQAFHEDSLEMLVLMCAHIGVLLTMSRSSEGSTRAVQELRLAIETRDVIGQAKGILMERHHITADAAFDVLRRSSQNLNRKLREVAEQLTFVGELPPFIPQSSPSIPPRID
jgi:GAF domain-containing protein